MKPPNHYRRFRFKSWQEICFLMTVLREHEEVFGVFARYEGRAAKRLRKRLKKYLPLAYNEQGSIEEFAIAYAKGCGAKQASVGY